MKSFRPTVSRQAATQPANSKSASLPQIRSRSNEYFLNRTRTNFVRSHYKRESSDVCPIERKQEVYKNCPNDIIVTVKMKKIKEIKKTCPL